MVRNLIAFLEFGFSGIIASLLILYIQSYIKNKKKNIGKNLPSISYILKVYSITFNKIKFNEDEEKIFKYLNSKQNGYMKKIKLLADLWKLDRKIFYSFMIAFKIKNTKRRVYAYYEIMDENLYLNNIKDTMFLVLFIPKGSEKDNMLEQIAKRSLKHKRNQFASKVIDLIENKKHKDQLCFKLIDSLNS